MSTAALKTAVQQPKKDMANMKPAEKVAHLLEARKESIAAMLPRQMNAERLLKVAQIAATTTPALLECEIPSLISAIGQCAQMGLEPNTVLGHAYLIPFSAKKNGSWVKNVQVIVGYKGLIDLARRSGHIVSIAAHEVRAKDIFELEYGLEEKLRHVPCLTGDRGPIIGFYAVAHLKDGGHAYDFMPAAEVDDIRDNSQGYKQALKSAEQYRKDATHPWIDHYAEMGKKTAVRRLAKMLPLSVEFATAAAIDEAGDRGQQPHLETIDGDYVVMQEDSPAIEHAPAETLPAAAQAAPTETIHADTGEITPASEHADPVAEQYLPDESATDWSTIAMNLMAKIEAARTKAEIKSISNREDYADAKAHCSPEIWEAVQITIRKRLEVIK
ncbi:MAG: recombinase RecT [Acidithiobacillus ferriphilus]